TAARHLGGGLRALEVAAEDVLPGEGELARLAWFGWLAVFPAHDGSAVQDGLTHGVRPFLCLLAGHREAVDAGLGEAVALAQVDTARGERGPHRLGAGRAARDRPAHAAQVGVAERRMLREHLEHRRHKEE